MTQPRRMGIKTWAKTAHEPTAANRAMQDGFLQDHQAYGGRIHAETIRALAATFEEPSAMATGHGLYLRMFNEYGTALETIGGWGWALRNRDRFPLFIDGLLSYQVGDVNDFYGLAQGPASLEELLAVPPIDELAALLVAAFPDADADDRRLALAQFRTSLCRYGQMYEREESVIVTTHNKGKHGATLYRPPDLDPREFYVIAPELCPTPSNAPPVRYSLRRFTVDRQMIETLRRAGEQTGDTVCFLAALTRGLSIAGRL